MGSEEIIPKKKLLYLKPTSRCFKTPKLHEHDWYLREFIWNKMSLHFDHLQIQISRSLTEFCVGLVLIACFHLSCWYYVILFVVLIWTASIRIHYYGKTPLINDVWLPLWRFHIYLITWSISFLSSLNGIISDFEHLVKWKIELSFLDMFNLLRKEEFICGKCRATIAIWW